MAIQACDLPAHALLQPYAQGSGYADCYITQLPWAVDMTSYIAAFYTTFLFKLERVVLAAARRPSSDHQAHALAIGASSSFAAWKVEARTEDQLLMCDLTGRTRSWFMTAPAQDNAQHRDAEQATYLYFGSAVTAVRDETTGRESIGPTFQATLGVHKLYSRALLQAASAKLRRTLGGAVDKR